MIIFSLSPRLQNGEWIGGQGGSRNGNREGVKLLHSTCQGRSCDQEAAAGDGEVWANLRGWRQTLCLSTFSIFLS